LTARDAAIELFRKRFGGEPEFIIRAPGRVNLIGDHTDYNDGFVLPMAIEQSTWAAVAARDDREVHLASVDRSDARFSLDQVSHTGEGWSEYVKGAAWAIDTGDIPGWDGAFATDIPIGAGLSSSAAIEIASMMAFNAASGGVWEPVQAALAAQRVENEWMGLGSGIMDQLIVATAQEHHATLIDCRTLDGEPTRMPDDVAVVILDTGTRRELVGSAYDERRRSCESAASAAGVEALRDLSLSDLDVLDDQLDDETFRRARHVISENDRTVEAAHALADGDIEWFGRLVNASHASLRDDFEVSSVALDRMVDIATSVDGCFGARMTGAGFGGCAVAFVAEPDLDAFVGEVLDRYRVTGTGEPNAYVTGAGPAAAIMTAE
jgi:galactokinase